MQRIGEVLDKAKDETIATLRKKMQEIKDKIMAGGGFRKYYGQRGLFFKITPHGIIINIHSDYQKYKGLIEYYIGEEEYNESTGQRKFKAIGEFERKKNGVMVKVLNEPNNYYTVADCYDIYEIGVKQKFNTKRYNFKKGEKPVEIDFHEKSLGEEIEVENFFEQGLSEKMPDTKFI